MEAAREGQEGLYCSTAGTYFQNKGDLEDHYRSDFHRRAVLDWAMLRCALLRMPSFCLLPRARRLPHPDVPRHLAQPRAAAAGTTSSARSRACRP